MSVKPQNNEQETPKETIRDYKPSTYLTWLQDVLKLINQYGMGSIFKALFVISMSSTVIYLAFNPEMVFEKIEQYQKTQHDNAIAYRFKTEPQIRLILKDMLIKTGASRSFVMELHNGSNNITGLPFLYCDMRYEEVNDGVADIDKEYQNVALARYPFYGVVYQKGQWAGSVNEVDSLDKRMGYKLKLNDTNYICMSVIYGVKREIGFVGISYIHGNENNMKDTETLLRLLRYYSQQISPLVDGDYLKQKNNI